MGNRLRWLFLGFCLIFSSCRKSEVPASELKAIEIAPRITIGSFNMLRLGHSKTKDLHRVARMIQEENFQIFAAQEVMTPEGAEDFLETLRENDTDWQMALSPSKTGENAYKEYFAFYYKSQSVKPILNPSHYCFKRNYGQERVGSTCFAKDSRSDGPDFERDPFIGHFRVGNREIAMISVHLVYGDQTSFNIERRQKEALALKKVMQDVRKFETEGLVFALGDFNLQLLEEDNMGKKAEFTSQLFLESPRLFGLVHDVTTVGKSSYDHFLFFANDRIAIRGYKTKVVSDVDRTDEVEKALYKKEVSDHFPIALVIP